MTDSVGSVGVKVVPDATGWDAEVEAAVGRTQVRVRIVLDEAAAKAQIDEATRDRDTKITADADTEKADVKIDRAARGRRTTITVTADTASANTKIDHAARNREATVKVKADTSGMGWLGTAILGLGPGVVPLAGGLTAGLAAASPLGAGLSGLGLFGAAAKNQVASTNAINKQLQSYAQQAQMATTQAGRTKALEQYARAYDKLNSSQLAFLKGESQMSAAWHKLTSGTDVFGPLTQGEEILTKILPRLKPLLDVTDKALTDILKNVDHYVSGGSFDHLVKNVSDLAGPGLRIGADTLGNFAKGLSGLGVALGPLGLQSLQGLDHLMARFATWGNGSSSEKQFISYLSTEGPKALHTLGDFVTAIAHVTEAAAPWGGVVLTTVDDLLKLLNKIPVNALSPVVTGIAGITLGLKAMKLAGGAGAISDVLLIAAIKAPVAEGALLNVGASLENVSTRLAKSKIAAGALGAGLATLAVSSTSSNQAVNVLGDTASGALMGFGVGGPIGAAVGGLAGLLGGALIAGIHGSQDAFHAAKADVSAWADAINQGNHAASEFAKNQLLTDLEKRPELLQAARAAGLSLPQVSRMVQQGTLSSVTSTKISDLERHRAALVAQAAQYGMFKDGKRNPNYENASGPHMQVIAAEIASLDSLVAHYKHLQQAADQFTHDSLSAQQEAWVRLQLSSTDYQKALAKLPSRVQTRIDAMNLKPTQAAIIDLAAKYNATPKSVQTLLATLGYDVSLKQVQNLVATAKQLDRSHMIQIGADTSAAINAFQGLSHFWKNIFGGLGLTDTVTNPKTHKSATAVAKVPIIGNLLAAGGPIVGPGTGTSDSILARVSNGEYVVNAAATAKFLPILEAINARRFATGGPVTPGQLASSLGSLPTRTKRSRPRGGIKPLTAQQLANAQYAFTLAESMSVTSIDKAFHNFSATLAAHGEHVVSTFDRLRIAAEKNVATYASTNAQLKTLQANASSIQSQAANSFNHAAFGGSFAELVTQLTADKNDATKMNAAILKARSHGLSGDFGAQLAASGNLLLAQQFAGLSRAQISSVQALYGARGKADTTLGATAAAFYSKEIARLTASEKALAAELRRLNRAAEQLPGAVQNGVAAGMRGQSTTISNRSRTG